MKKILVIEDNLEVRENLQEILELANYEVEVAENGIEGVKAVRSTKPNLILCDIMMPELDGFGVLKILNKDPELFHIPFMFLTAKTEKADLRKGMGLGADDYIMKPFDDVELLDAIEIRLKKSASLQRVSNEPQGVHHFLNEAKAQDATEKLLAEKEEREYDNKSIIFHESQHPKYLYYIKSGAVKCYKSSDSGKELITTLYKTGDFFGLISLINEHPYHETAETVEPTEVMLIPAQDFRLLMYNDRDFSARFIKLLATHADRSEEQLIDLAFSSVRRKVSRALIGYVEKMETYKCDLSRDDLAAIAGTARETLIRTISDFKSEKLVDIEDGCIIVLDLERLKQLPQ